MTLAKWQQARSQVLRLGETKYIFKGARFLFLSCLKQFFSGRNKIWGPQKYLLEHCPRMPPVATGLSGSVSEMAIVTPAYQEQNSDGGDFFGNRERTIKPSLLIPVADKNHRICVSSQGRRRSRCLRNAIQQHWQICFGGK